MNREGRGIAFLMLAGTVLLSAGLGLRDPWPPDEPRFALIAREMLESGNWLIPRIGGVLYPDKPPLFFWVVAGFYAVTDSIRISLLLPSLFSGLGVLWLIYDLARRLWNAEAALWCSGALLATVQFPLQMKAGQIDGLLLFWTTLGLYGLSRHLLLGPAWGWYAVGGLACGLGVITKGVGFLPMLVLLPWWFAHRQDWPLPNINWSDGRWLLAPLALVLVISLWLVPMLAATGDGADPELARYRDDILFRQTVTRYADAWGHLKPPWYLFTNAIPGLWLPLSLLLPWLVPQWIQNLRLRDAPTLLFAVWLLLVLLFFSLSDGKRSVYILPALPALVLLSGRHLPTILARVGAKTVVFTLALLIALSSIAAGIYVLENPRILAPWIVQADDVRTVATGVLTYGLMATAVVILLRLQHAARAFAAIMAMAWLAISLAIYPRIDAARSGRSIISMAEKYLVPGGSLAFAGWKEQMLLQWSRPAVHFGYRRKDVELEGRDAASWLLNQPDYQLLLPLELTVECFDLPLLTDLGYAHRREWFLASAASVLPQCDEAGGLTEAAFYDPKGGNEGMLRTAIPIREKAPGAARSPP